MIKWFSWAQFTQWWKVSQLLCSANPGCVDILLTGFQLDARSVCLFSHCVYILRIILSVQSLCVFRELHSWFRRWKAIYRYEIQNICYWLWFLCYSHPNKFCSAGSLVWLSGVCIVLILLVLLPVLLLLFPGFR